MVDKALTGMRRWQETWQGHVCSGTKAQACMSDWLGCLWTVFFSKRHIAYFSMSLFYGSVKHLQSLFALEAWCASQ